MQRDGFMQMVGSSLLTLGSGRTTAQGRLVVASLIIDTSFCISIFGGVGIVHFFFFQAKNGIRDLIVTGVQTCALPIYLLVVRHDRLPGRRTLSRVAENWQ